MSVAVQVAGRDYTLVAAVNEATGELKYFVTNATDQPLRVVLLVAFRRATIEHGFRVGKQEAGLMHFEGRHYAGLMRHLILALIVLGFVSAHTERLRGGKPTGDDGAGVPRLEPPLLGAAGPPPRDTTGPARGLRDPLPPAPQRAGHTLTPKAAA